MHGSGAIPGFGPDESTGLIPTPHVLAYYAIFFGFRRTTYTEAPERLTGWAVAGRIQLPLALMVLPIALALALHFPWGRELAGDEGTRRLLASLGEVLYTWLMVFGLIGLSEKVLNRERPRVRYASDSSYWLYLVHLPLIIIGQAMLRNANLPAAFKITLLVVIVTAILLISYQFLVRYTWIGRLLNGPRARHQFHGSMVQTVSYPTHRKRP